MVLKDEQVEASGFTYDGREVDLCPECAVPFLTVAQVVEEYGRRADGKRGPYRKTRGRVPEIPEGVEGVPCPECGKTYANQSRMSEHVRRVHPETRSGPPYVCEECGEEFTKPQGLGAHKRKHKSAAAES